MLQQNCSRTSAICGSGALFRKGPKGVGREQVPQLSCFRLCLAARLPGAARAEQGQAARASCSPGQAQLFHPKNDRALAAPLLHHQQLAEDQPQLVSALFQSMGCNLERHEAQGQLSGLH